MRIDYAVEPDGQRFVTDERDSTNTLDSYIGDPRVCNKLRKESSESGHLTGDLSLHRTPCRRSRKS